MPRGGKLAFTRVAFRADFRGERLKDKPVAFSAISEPIFESLRRLRFPFTKAFRLGFATREIFL